MAAARDDHGGGEAGGLPVLWHLKVSHYNEKARWALDHKGIPHVRRAVTPGSHPKLARKLTGADTLPVLVLDGRAIGDSTRIITELERYRPDPPLYPTDPELRRRALELEEHFDEELGPYSRLLTMNHALQEPDLFLGVFTSDLTGIRRTVARRAFPAVRRRVESEFGISDESVADARERLTAAGERFRSEVGESGYLAGDGFTVADLTLATMVAPIIAPEQFPYPQPQRHHALFTPLRELLAPSGLEAWARDIYARHRGVSAAVEDHS